MRKAKLQRTAISGVAHCEIGSLISTHQTCDLWYFFKCSS